MPKGHLLKDMTGLRFTRLLVQSRAGTDKQGNATWHCRCDCGTTLTTRGFQLRNGESKSCGCLTTDQLIERNTSHGKTGTREWWTWIHMQQRCENPNSRRYERYGGRGIKICKRWRDSFENFLSDMGQRPSPLHTIERIDNDGDYEPKNCKWATKQEQNHNTSQTRFVQYKGKRLSLTQAVQHTTSGITRGGAFSRLRRGWTVEQALDTPVDKTTWANRKAYRTRKKKPHRHPSGK